MQKVHGAPANTGIEVRRGYFAQPVMGPVVVGLLMLLILCALIYAR